MRKHLWLLVLLLAACTPTPPKPTPPEPVDPVAAAYAAREAENWSEAGTRFEGLAATDPARATEYRLLAADAYARAGRSDAAQRVLATLQAAALNGEQRMRRQLIEAHVAVQQDPDLALSLLLEPATPGAPAPLLARYHELRAAAFGRLGSHFEAAREYLHRELFLTESEAIEANQQALWRQLGQLPAADLQRHRVHPPPDVLSGWIDLVLITQTAAADPAALERQLAQWRRDYPYHGAAQALLDDLFERSKELSKRPGHIAVLLPLEGRFASAGVAVRDGILAAYFADRRTDKPLLQFYDTAADPQRALALYERAVELGAGFVIGPLDKEGVRFLARQGELAVPTLALNYAETPLNGDLYQFSLAPEDEAQQLAEVAWQLGHRNALALVPAGEWGERIVGAFSARWESLGGTLLESAAYAPQESDFAAPITALLNVDDSEARRAQLVRQIGTPVKFEPHRRQDVDFVFLAAFPRQARLLRPQLRFHHAVGVPVYATSHVYGGRPEPEQDHDMDGILFADMPWTLDAGSETGLLIRDEAGAVLAKHRGTLQRLVALGIDAYRLVDRLPLLEEFPAERFGGESGELSVDPERRIRRELLWARFEQGEPRLLELQLMPLPEQMPEVETIGDMESGDGTAAP